MKHSRKSSHKQYSVNYSSIHIPYTNLDVSLEWSLYTAQQLSSVASDSKSVGFLKTNLLFIILILGGDVATKILPKTVMDSQT